MLASGLTSGSAQAQPYPARTVTVVVPIAAGGAVDTTARIFAEQLQAKLGQHFIVENRTGAGATIGAAYVAQAAPDGYTLLLMESSAPVAKWLYKNPSFDVLKDFTPIARIVSKSPCLVRQSIAARQGFEGVDCLRQRQSDLVVRWRLENDPSTRCGDAKRGGRHHDHSCPLSRDGTCGE